MKFIINLIFVAFIIFGFQTFCFAQIENSKNLCANISKIKILPRHDEKIEDEAYNDLLEIGKKAIPCLIERITDTTKMEDPRCPKITNDFVVGDMAYFVLYRIAKFGFVEMLPPDVRESYKTKGVYAYHIFVDQKGNRKFLQKTLKKWYSQRTP